MKTKLKLSTLTVAAVSAVSIASCATIVSGSTQTLHVQAIDAKDRSLIPNAKCSITDSKGNIYTVDSNPGTLQVTRSNGSLKANCKAPGYTQKEVGTGTNFNAWTIANVLFWPGFIIDGISGSYSKYPDHITVVMAK